MDNDKNNENARNENFTGILHYSSYLCPLLGSVLSFLRAWLFFRLDRKFTEEIFEFIGLIDLKTHGYHLTLTCFYPKDNRSLTRFQIRYIQHFLYKNFL